MSNILIIQNKLFSLFGEIYIKDESGNIVLNVKGCFAFFVKPWKIFKNDDQICEIKKMIATLVPTWSVSSIVGDFIVKRKLFSLTRHYTVHGGKFDGITVNSNLIDLKYEIYDNSEKLIARSTGKFFTLRDTHKVELIDISEDYELIIAILVTITQIDRKKEANNRNNTL